MPVNETIKKEFISCNNLLHVQLNPIQSKWIVEVPMRSV